MQLGGVFNFFVLLFLFLMSSNSLAQGCCSGGSGSPIAGGASQGVLKDRQMEIGLSYQNVLTKKSFSKDSDTLPLIDKFSSNYLYFRLAYGLTKDLTISVETGYFINKTQVGLNKRDTIHSSGIGDLILFPRYTVLSKNTEAKRSEITLGLGYKIPLGKHDDSTVVYTDPSSGKKYYITSPPMVQTTTGSHDFIFYSFFYRGYPYKDFRLFLTTMYISTGWNSLGQKFGNYASVSIYAGKTFYKKIGLTLQIRGEWMAKLQSAKNIDMVALYNVYPESTGGRKILIVPQFNYTYKAFTFFCLSEFPIYQYLNGNQIGSERLITVGLSSRFNTYK